jgi:glutathione S-transferase
LFRLTVSIFGKLSSETLLWRPRVNDAATTEDAARPTGSVQVEQLTPAALVMVPGTLTHFRLCPLSRSIRIALEELRVDVAFVEEQPWAWQPAFLALNPSGELPVLSLDSGFSLCGVYAISEFLAEAARHSDGDDRCALLFPGSPEQRAEIRRLVDWFQTKFYREVTRELLVEKVYARLSGAGAARSAANAPDPAVLRALAANLRYHLSYIAYLTHQRSWLAGDDLSFADFAAGAQLSVIDYLGDAPWDDYPAARAWYQRLKSRPSMRTVLADRMPGMAPPAAYSNLDF